ncbi:hypothetical protein BDV95DRAFT_286482 [Massariosphaeria phaeospora]|uniref:Secreted protein n=1 Tax=Massariosphaeria phaeospora TaxID=100035 RepID=A0A7C8IC50_9PLEO|nr:hypothetical protein BDV95DRAFT_286482 [Massariosphaeria phaeospora]
MHMLIIFAVLAQIPWPIFVPNLRAVKQPTHAERLTCSATCDENVRRLRARHLNHASRRHACPFSYFSMTGHTCRQITSHPNSVVDPRLVCTTHPPNSSCLHYASSGLLPFQLFRIYGR